MADILKIKCDKNNYKRNENRQMIDIRNNFIDYPPHNPIIQVYIVMLNLK
jgi:hypothetical protein